MNCLCVWWVGVLSWNGTTEKGFEWDDDTNSRRWLCGEEADGRKGTLRDNYVLHLQPFNLYPFPTTERERFGSFFSALCFCFCFCLLLSALCPLPATTSPNKQWIREQVQPFPSLSLHLREREREREASDFICFHAFLDFITSLKPITRPCQIPCVPKQQNQWTKMSAKKKTKTQIKIQNPKIHRASFTEPIIHKN